MNRLTLICLFIAVVSLSACETVPMQTMTQKAEHTKTWPRRDLTSREKTAIQSALKQSLIDPTAVLYRWPKFITNPHSALAIYCGEVNSKNSFGGYVGFVPYQVYVYHNGGRVSAQVIGIGSGAYRGDSLSILDSCASNGYLYAQLAGY